MPEIINSLKTGPTVEPTFSWSPSGTYTYSGTSGITLTAPKALVGVLLTFTATTQIDNDATGRLTVVEYYWDFGDGTFSYGNGATHTYIVANLQARTVLRVTDSRGRPWVTRQQMYLT